MHCSSFSTRNCAEVRVCTSFRRYRVSWRRSRIARGGTKFFRISPCRNSCAIHSASFMSVFRPGTFAMCRALPSTISSDPSSTRYTGIQYTPVLSIATCVHPRSNSQLRIRSNSSRKVPNVRVFTVGGLLRPSTQHATIRFLCTSRPAPTNTTTSMTPSFLRVFERACAAACTRSCSACLSGIYFRTTTNGGTYSDAGPSLRFGARKPPVRYPTSTRFRTRLASDRLGPPFDLRAPRRSAPGPRPPTLGMAGALSV